MENKIGSSFDNLAQRIIYSYAATFPEFTPVKSQEASENSQYDLYCFLKEIICRLYENPVLLAFPTHEDEYYEDWELQKNKPKLIVEMRNYLKRINDFYQNLIQLGEEGVIRGDTLCIEKEHLKLSGSMLKKLEQFGLSCEIDKIDVVLRCKAHSSLFPAWKLLVRISGKQPNPVIFFSRCMFDVDYSYPKEIFYSLVDEKHAFKTLQEYFETNGYKRVDCRENQVSLDWAKNYGIKEEPLKASWGEREHGGISIWFDYSKNHQVFFGLRIPRYKEILAHFDEMEDGLKTFVISKAKKCDGCGYCTQTDKTGTRKPQSVTVTHNGEYELCMLFPGFTYIWTKIDDTTATDIISFLTYIDLLFSGKGKC